MTGRVVSAVGGTADVVEGGANAVGEVVADVVESAGNGAQDLLRRGSGRASVLAWVGSIVAGLANVIGAVVKGGAGAVGGGLAGLIRAVGGLVALDRRLVARGLIDVGSGTMGGLLVVLGASVSLVQRIVGVQSRDRQLSDGEREILRSVFVGSLALYNIRLIEGRSGAFGFNGRPFTLGNTIYMKRIDVATRPGVLVHECVHVWQYQNVGSRYTTDALGAQARYGPGAYDWRAELARGHGRWTDFNKEAQAELFQDLWDEGALTASSPDDGAHTEVASAAGGNPAVARFVTSDGNNRTVFANESIAVLRSQRSRRLSASFDRPRRQRGQQRSGLG